MCAAVANVPSSQQQGGEVAGEGSKAKSRSQWCAKFLGALRVAKSALDREGHGERSELCGGKTGGAIQSPSESSDRSPQPTPSRHQRLGYPMLQRFGRPIRLAELVGCSRHVQLQRWLSVKDTLVQGSMKWHQPCCGSGCSGGEDRRSGISCGAAHGSNHSHLGSGIGAGAVAEARAAASAVALAGSR